MTIVIESVSTNDRVNLSMDVIEASREIMEKKLKKGWPIGDILPIEASDGSTWWLNLWLSGNMKNEGREARILPSQVDSFGDPEPNTAVEAVLNWRKE